MTEALARLRVEYTHVAPPELRDVPLLDVHLELGRLLDVPDRRRRRAVEGEVPSVLQLGLDERRDASPHPRAMLSRIARGSRLMNEKPVRSLLREEIWSVGAAARVPTTDVRSRDPNGQQGGEHLGAMIADDPHSEI